MAGTGGGRPRLREAVRLGDVIAQTLHRLGLDRPRARLPIAEAWAEALGPALAAQTRLMGVQKGVLTVQVPSPVIRQELENFRGAELLKKLQEALPGVGIRKIRFSVGR